LTDSLNRVLSALNEVAETSQVWPRGLLNPGGPHHVLTGTLLPISIGEDECAVFERLIERFRPAHAFIVGNAFGFSSCYIAEVMRQHGGQRVVTLDSEIEGRGQACAVVARQLTQRLDLTLITNKKGRSPEDTAWAVETDRHDLVFIDGDHRHPQVTRDFEGILPYTNAKTIFVWHDFWMTGILPCLRTAASYGFRWLWLPTSCEMVLGVRDAATFADLQEMFPEGVENQRPHSPLLAPTILTKEYARQAWEFITNRYISQLRTVRRTE
jgi:predicted O-methyltransferase YrrM